MAMKAPWLALVVAGVLLAAAAAASLEARWETECFLGQALPEEHESLLEVLATAGNKTQGATSATRAAPKPNPKSKPNALPGFRSLKGLLRDLRAPAALKIYLREEGQRYNNSIKNYKAFVKADNGVRKQLRKLFNDSAVVAAKPVNEAKKKVPARPKALVSREGQAYFLALRDLALAQREQARLMLGASRTLQRGLMRQVHRRAEALRTLRRAYQNLSANRAKAVNKHMAAELKSRNATVQARFAERKAALQKWVQGPVPPGQNATQVVARRKVVAGRIARKWSRNVQTWQVRQRNLNARRWCKNRAAWASANLTVDAAQVEINIVDARNKTLTKRLAVQKQITDKTIEYHAKRAQVLSRLAIYPSATARVVVDGQNMSFPQAYSQLRKLGVALRNALAPLRREIAKLDKALVAEIKGLRRKHRARVKEGRKKIAKDRKACMKKAPLHTVAVCSRKACERICGKQTQQGSQGKQQQQK